MKCNTCLYGTIDERPIFGPTISCSAPNGYTLKTNGNCYITSAKYIRNNLKLIINTKEENISELKIYFDLLNKIFKRKILCCECNIPIGCKCYKTLEDAVSDAKEPTIYCNTCFIFDMFFEHKDMQYFVNNLSPNKNIDKLINLYFNSSDYKIKKETSEILINLIKSLTKEQESEIIELFIERTNFEHEIIIGEICKR